MSQGNLRSLTSGWLCTDWRESKFNSKTATGSVKDFCLIAINLILDPVHQAYSLRTESRSMW